MSLYLVTGGAGFIGSHIATALTERGDRVRVLDNLTTGRVENLAHLEVGGLGSGAPVELLEGDIRDPEAARAGCRGAAGVFHEAAMVSVPRSVEEPELSYDVNAIGTLRVLEAARAEGIERVVYAASSSAYGDSPTLPKHEDMPSVPRSPYAAAKLAGEHILAVWGRVYGMRTVSLRYFNIFGPRQADDSPYTGVIAIFSRALLLGGEAKIFGDGEQSRDFTFVENAVQANLLAMEADVEPGEVLNVGAGEQVSITALFERMRELCGSSLEASYEPPRAGDVRDSLASLDKSRRLLGYEPRVGWGEGLERTVAWYRDRFGAQSVPG
ncbi:MAG: SDR family oxidoreductase [Planctomycetota bacterium]|nr:SDR family oxidoreductase [Planctomycetota bacterium]MCZ6792157.1 SDR family oxidoreductase [Planctomycetota bacterium]